MSLEKAKQEREKLLENIPIKIKQKLDRKKDLILELNEIDKKLSEYDNYDDYQDDIEFFDDIIQKYEFIEKLKNKVYIDYDNEYIIPITYDEDDNSVNCVIIFKDMSQSINSYFSLSFTLYDYEEFIKFKEADKKELLTNVQKTMNFYNNLLSLQEQRKEKLNSLKD